MRARGSSSGFLPPPPDNRPGSLRRMTQACAVGFARRLVRRRLAYSFSTIAGERESLSGYIRSRHFRTVTPWPYIHQASRPDCLCVHAKARSLSRMQSAAVRTTLERQPPAGFSPKIVHAVQSSGTDLIAEPCLWAAQLGRLGLSEDSSHFLS